MSNALCSPHALQLPQRKAMGGWAIVKRKIDGFVSTKSCRFSVFSDLIKGSLHSDFKRLDV